MCVLSTLKVEVSRDSDVVLRDAYSWTHRAMSSTESQPAHFHASSHLVDTLSLFTQETAAGDDEGSVIKRTTTFDTHGTRRTGRDRDTRGIALGQKRKEVGLGS